MRVRGLASMPAAAYAGLLLSEPGAVVLALDVPDADLDAGVARYVNRDKQRVSLDVSGQSGVTEFLRLAQDVDGLVEDLGPGGLEAFDLSPARLRQQNPSLVV